MRESELLQQFERLTGTFNTGVPNESTPLYPKGIDKDTRAAQKEYERRVDRVRLMLNAARNRTYGGNG